MANKGNGMFGRNGPIGRGKNGGNEHDLDLLVQSMQNETNVNLNNNPSVALDVEAQHQMQW
jgi:hypothetical protein